MTEQEKSMYNTLLNPMSKEVREQAFRFEVEHEQLIQLNKKLADHPELAAEFDSRRDKFERAYCVRFPLR
jgi:hypothetical protein